MQQRRQLSAVLPCMASKAGGLAFFSSLPSSWKAKLAAASPRAGPLPWVTGRADSTALAMLHLLSQHLPLLSISSPHPSQLLSPRAANLTVLTVCAKHEGSPEETPCVMLTLTVCRIHFIPLALWKLVHVPIKHQPTHTHQTNLAWSLSTQRWHTCRNLLSSLVFPCKPFISKFRTLKYNFWIALLQSS